MVSQDWYEKEVTNRYEEARRNLETTIAVYEDWIQQERKRSYAFEKVSLIPGPAYLFYRLTDLALGNTYSGWDILADATVGLPAMTLFFSGFNRLIMRDVKPNSMEAAIGFTKKLMKEWEKDYQSEISRVRNEYDGLTSIESFLKSI